MHWVLQDNLFNEKAYQILVDTLARFDIPYSIHKVIPFVGELTPAPGQLIPCVAEEFQSCMCEYGTKGCRINHKNVICMGSYSLRHAAAKAGWTPGVFDLEPFNFEQQLQHWGTHMLNHDAVVSDFEQAIVLAFSFLRPIEDSKVFAGAMFEPEEFLEWQRKVCVLEEDFGTSLTGKTKIQVCSAKKIYAEYRFWIVRGEIVSASMYKQGDKIMYSDRVDGVYFDYVRARIAEWSPHHAFVIDVCALPEDEIKIVEINTLNSCGFYACDIPKLVCALENAFNQKLRSAKDT